jgi:hypothetical protein
MSHPDIPLPASLRPFFWDISFESLSWDSHRDFIIRRLLRSGDWDTLHWLRGQLGEEALRRWIVEHEGGGLSPRQLRFWALILDLEAAQVNRWIETLKSSVWEQRVQR